jgi:peptide/nickel transport system permease protein
MLPFILRRIGWTLVIAWVVASLAFVLGRVAGSDVIAQSFGIGAPEHLVDAARKARGLDRPLSEAYGTWLVGILRGDFGRSALGRSVGSLVGIAARNTALLTATALVLAVGIGLPAGVVAGSRRTGALTTVIRACSLGLLSAPPLLTSLLLVWVAAVSGIAPVGGMSSGVQSTLAASVVDVLAHLPVPALALALPFAASLERVQAEAMARALADPSMTAARARGVDRRGVLWRHAWRLGAGSVLSVGGLMAGALLGGSVAVELVTSWPGLGRLTVDAMFGRDVYLSAGCAVAGALLLSVGVLAGDVAMAIADPRVLDLEDAAGAAA